MIAVGSQGINDITIAGCIFTVLFISSIVLPMLYGDLTASNVNSLNQSLTAGGSLSDTTEIGILGITGQVFSAIWAFFKVIIGVLFYTLGVPLWINIVVLMPMRFVMWFVIIRNLPIIGNGG